MSTPQPRVRFCPAPSGWLHVGGARTAEFNWLWARRQGGTLVLRVEDTDAERATLESAEQMLAALEWLGLDWDEGPAIGSHAAMGAHGPYLQSERRPLHDVVVRRLLEAGHAYEAFETAEELEAQREAGQHVYKRSTAPAVPSEGRDAVVRIETPTGGEVTWQDEVRGTVAFDWSEIGDFVIARADGSPTYMLANVVDDLAQGIGFVARGEDLLAATPRQILMAERLTGTALLDEALLDEALLDEALLDEALSEVGYPARPEGAPDRLSYAHLPLLVGEDRKKLSKRHGDVAIGAFRDAGFLPEVLVNFLALCGWSPGEDRERMSVDELVEAFSFDRVQSSPAFFDTDKLRSLNGDAIKELDDEDFGARLIPFFQAEGLVDTPPTPAQADLVHGFAPLLKDRSQTLAEAPSFVSFAFRDEITWDDKAVQKWLKPAAGPVLQFVTPRLEALESWTPEAIMGVFEAAVAELEVGMGKAMQPVRVVVTGTAVSPPLPETLAVLDRDWVLDRVRAGHSMVPEA